MKLLLGSIPPRSNFYKLVLELFQFAQFYNRQDIYKYGYSMDTNYLFYKLAHVIVLYILSFITVNILLYFTPFCYVFPLSI